MILCNTRYILSLPPSLSLSLSFSQDAMVRLTSDMYMGNEGDLAFVDVCVVASLTPTGTLQQTPLVVDLMTGAISDTAIS